MPIIYKGLGPRKSDPRAKAAERFNERRGDDRRDGPDKFTGHDRRADQRRTGERRIPEIGSFSREASKKLVGMIEDEQQTLLLKRGKLSCPDCGGQLKSKAPTRWGGKTVWDVSCRGCNCTFVHKIK